MTVYAPSCYEARERPQVTRMHHPAPVMIWWGVLHRGTTQIHFCEQAVKIDKKVYRRMSEEKVKLLGYPL